MAAVYLLLNETNLRVYVGATEHSVAQRWSQHKADARDKSNHAPLAKAIRRYGEESFRVFTLAICHPDQLESNKIELMKRWRSDLDGNYNVTARSKRKAANLDRNRAARRDQARRTVNALSNRTDVVVIPPSKNQGVRCA